MTQLCILPASRRVLQALVVISLMASPASADFAQGADASDEATRLLQGPARAVLSLSELAEWEHRLRTSPAALPDLEQLVADRLEVRYRIAVYDRYRSDRAAYEQTMARYRAERSEYASDAGERLAWLATIAPGPLREKLNWRGPEPTTGPLKGTHLLAETPPRVTEATRPRHDDLPVEIVMVAPSDNELVPEGGGSSNWDDPAPAPIHLPAPVFRGPPPPAAIDEVELAASVDGVNFAAGLLQNALEQDRGDASALARLFDDVSELLRRRRSLDLYLAITPEVASPTPWRKLDALVEQFTQAVDSLASASDANAATLAPVQRELHRISASASRTADRR